MTAASGSSRRLLSIGHSVCWPGVRRSGSGADSVGPASSLISHSLCCSVRTWEPALLS